MPEGIPNQEAPQAAVAALSKQLETIPVDSDEIGQGKALEALQAIAGVALISPYQSVKINTLTAQGALHSIEPTRGNLHHAAALKKESLHLAAAIGVTSNDAGVHYAAINSIAQVLETTDFGGNHSEAVLWIGAVANSSTDTVKIEAINLLRAYQNTREINRGYEGSNVSHQAQQQASQVIAILGLP